ncbi:MAG: N-acetylglucosaminyltransferase [Bdellovibrionales bacterium]|nr:N-acetylglucosaminyltransferase [Bdellovibrionales bacterium]
MIYDCFAFFNELDLLDLRLKELSPVVDKFVIVEATKTFQKTPKPLYFQQNKDRYKEYEDKIIHVVVDTYPNFFTKWRVPRTWDYDNAQKEFILKGLKGARPDDTVIVSDIDEIPLRSKVREFAHTPGIRVFEQYLSYYYLNNICTFIPGESAQFHGTKNKQGFGFWRGSVMVEYSRIQSIKKTRLFRDKENAQTTVIPKGGWHFSYMGGVDMIIKKIEAWTHDEYNKPEFKSPEHILQSIRSGTSLFDKSMTFKLFPLDDTSILWPEALLESPERFKSMILV